jgi:hypothetical protein
VEGTRWPASPVNADLRWMSFWESERDLLLRTAVTNKSQKDIYSVMLPSNEGTSNLGSLIDVGVIVP